MKWFVVFTKGIKEQIRDYWILVMIVVMAPLFIAIYYLMVETDQPQYDIIIVNGDTGVKYDDRQVNLGDSLVVFGRMISYSAGISALQITAEIEREEAVDLLRRGRADVVLVLPENLSSAVYGQNTREDLQARLELIGDATRMEYVVGAVWTEELITRYILETAGIEVPVSWKETTLGQSGNRSAFELYVPGLLVLSIIMIIFSASAAIVREPETRTLERLKISRLTALEFLAGLSLVQLIIGMISLLLALATAILLGYHPVPGSMGFLLLICFLTSLSMISFSLIVAAICRSIKDVAIIGTFPLFLLMFFTGAAFPVGGGKLFRIGDHTVMLNDLLSPKFAVEALNKVLIRGLDTRETLPEMLAILVLTLLYLVMGTWLFRKRHMKPQ